jgi:hypothetical protein
VLTSIIIIIISLMLFVYWFRYTCILILSSKTTKDYASQIAQANQLRFLETRNTLLASSSSTVALDSLQQSLDQDYRLLSYLLRHAVNYNVAGMSFEQVLLKVDFQVMSVWYSIVLRLSPERARNALLEMTSIVIHLANAMGERVAITTRS